MLDEEQQLIAKLRKIEALFSNPGTDGERQAAASASERIRARLAELEATDPAAEFRFTMTDTWSRSLLLALLRRHGLKPYRYSGQRRTTVMVKVAKSYLDTTVMPEFEQFRSVLHEHFTAVTRRVISQALGESGSDVEVREEPGALENRE